MHDKFHQMSASSPNLSIAALRPNCRLALNAGIGSPEDGPKRPLRRHFDPATDFLATCKKSDNKESLARPQEP